MKQKQLTTEKSDEKRRPTPSEQIVQDGLHPHPGPDRQEEQEDTVDLETIKVTCMEHNKKLVNERQAGIIVFQEHKIKAAEEKAKRSFFEQQG